LDVTETPLQVLQLSIEYIEADGSTVNFMVFATEEGLRLLAAAKIVYMDGTFGITPVPFYSKHNGQIFTLNTLFGVETDEALYTRVLVITERRTELFYKVFFGALIDHIVNELDIQLAQIAWAECVLDFETALIPALTALNTVVFLPMGRQLSLDGCHFHFASALFKNLCVFGLKSLYSVAENGLKKFVSLLIAMAFCNPADIPVLFLAIIAERFPAGFETTDIRVVRFIEYVDRQWIRNRNLPISMWSVFNVKRNRTNNKLESKHNQMRLFFGVHSTLWVFLQNVCSFSKIEREDERSHRVQGTSTHRAQSSAILHREARLGRQRALYDQQQITALAYVDMISSEMRNFSSEDEDDDDVDV
jgi:hypothetical protein